MEVIDVAIAMPTAPDIEQTQEAPVAPLVFRVRATEQHIRDGGRGYSSGCPLALAIRARGFDHALVAREIAYWCRWSGNTAVFARPLPETAEFIRRFDAGLPVEPGEYGFEVPG
jgi:hypothetical protein